MLYDLSNDFSSTNDVRIVEMLYFYMNVVLTNQVVELELTRVAESKTVDSILFLFSHFYFLFHLFSILDLGLGVSIMSYNAIQCHTSVTSCDHIL